LAKAKFGSLVRWTRGKEKLERMSQEIVRCPYCVLGDEFRPMFRRSRKRFICLVCGHTATPDPPYSKCHCTKCRRMNLIASRCKSGVELYPPMATSLRSGHRQT